MGTTYKKTTKNTHTAIQKSNKNNKYNTRKQIDAYKTN